MRGFLFESLLALITVYRALLQKSRVLGFVPYHLDRSADSPGARDSCYLGGRYGHKAMHQMQGN